MLGTLRTCTVFVSHSVTLVNPAAGSMLLFRGMLLLITRL